MRGRETGVVVGGETHTVGLFALSTSVKTLHWVCYYYCTDVNNITQGGWRSLRCYLPKLPFTPKTDDTVS
jgi:hypothetical protein